MEKHNYSYSEDRIRRKQYSQSAPPPSEGKIGAEGQIVKWAVIGMVAIGVCGALYQAIQLGAIK